MKIFVPNEMSRGETRVALVPGAVKRLGVPGVEILVESNAGA
ncbi:MAG: NAD(P)(+) transhydrogenase (Re/Si-specific) subunit alpha, partial [Tepidisphaeraceae bacterium]